jgi:hypothetical protein
VDLLGEYARFVAGLEPAEFAAFTIGGALLAAVSLERGFRSLARKRLAEDTPTTLLRSAAQGYVELSGTARVFDGERIRAPLTGRECSWYAFEVEHRERGSNSDSRWRTVDKGSSTELFMLDDGTGSCAVDPEDAEVTPSVTNVWFGRSATPPRLTAQRHWLLRLFATESYRYTEKIIEIGQPLYALGFLRTHGGAATPIDDSADVATLLREWKADRASLLRRYDRNGDGEIDVAEWEQARRDATAEIRAARAERSHAPPAIDVLAKPPTGRQPFVLSAGGEAHHTRGHAWAVAAWLSAGIATAIAIGIGMLIRLGSA